MRWAGAGGDSTAAGVGGLSASGRAAGSPAGGDPAQRGNGIHSERAAGWLETNGGKVARRADGKVDAIIEIAQTTAIYPDDLKSVKLPKAVERGAKLRL